MKSSGDWSKENCGGKNRKKRERKKRRRKKEKTKRRENDGSKKGGRIMGNLGWGRRSDQEIGFSKVPQVDICLQKKASKRMPTKKLWDHVIEIKKGFVPRKRKLYPLLRDERYVSSLKNNWGKGILDPWSCLK